MIDGLALSLSPDAVEFIRHLAGGSLEDYVLTIAPHTEREVLNVAGDDLAEAVQEVLERLPLDRSALRSMKLVWVLGVSRRSRFPADDVHLIDGVYCFVPHEMRSVVAGRRLVLVEGELRLSPEPDPPEM